MDNTLRHIEYEDIIILQSNQYSVVDRSKYLEVFQKYVSEDKIRAEFSDSLWNCYNGIKRFEINFSFDEMQYQKHIGGDFNITPAKMTDMLKCYTIYICGEYIFRTITQKINGIKNFITCFGDKDFSLKPTELLGVIDFLGFIGTPEKEIERIDRQIQTKKIPNAKPRELANLINYLAISNEIDDMYSGEISDAEFIHWFPIFFWSKVTFILPLRATEMLTTPYNCIERKYGKVFLSVRRSKLKKGERRVYYNVDQDYKVFTYQYPDNDTIKMIEKYQQLTSTHKRRFLFDFDQVLVINGLMSLTSFNALLEDFIIERLVGNRKYDYARFASGISEFSVVTAGDARPIAMANLYYQDAGADICRQLADHINLTTSEGYYQNVSNTVYASSIMKYQRKINYGQEMSKTYQKVYSEIALADRSLCSSENQPKLTGDISDCVREKHLDECLGCRYYTPSESELKQELENRKKKLDEASIAVVKCMADMQGGVTKHDEDFNKIFLDAYTSIVRCKTACDEKAKEVVGKWQRYHDSAMNS